MKQHSGDEIRQIMADVPAELVAELQATHPNHNITEWEARWWAYLQFARTGAYDGTSYTIKVNGTGEEAVSEFLAYTLSNRLSDERAGLVRKPWPDGGFEKRAP